MTEKTFSMMRAEIKQHEATIEYWRTRATESQELAYNSGLWTGAVGACLACGFIFCIFMIVFG